MSYTSTTNNNEIIHLNHPEKKCFFFRGFQRAIIAMKNYRLFFWIFTWFLLSNFLYWLLHHTDISDCISSSAFCQYHLASFKFKSIFAFRICAGNICSFIVSTWKIQFLSTRKSVNEISWRFRNLFVTSGNFFIQYRIKCIVIMLFHIGSAIWFERPRWCLHRCRPDIGYRKTSQNHKQ